MATGSEVERARRQPSTPYHALLATDVDDVVVQWSEGATVRYGWAADDVVGRHLTAILEPLNGADHDDEVAGRHVHHQVGLLRRKDGSRVVVHSVVVPVRDDAARWTGSLWVVLTPGEGLAAEHAAVRAEARLAAVRGGFGIGTWEWNLRTGDTWRDGRLRRLLRVPDGEPDGPVETWIDQVHPDDRHIARNFLVAPLTGEVPDATFRIVRDDGELLVVLARAEVSEWHDGAPSRVTGVLVDVTEERQAAQRVVETVEAISDGYFTLDGDWRFSYVNRVAERLLGQERDDLVGTSIWNAFPAAVMTEFDRQYTRAVETCQPVEFEAYFEPLRSWFEVRAYPHAGGMSVYFRDVNDRHAAAAEHERLRRDERTTRARAEALHAELLDAATNDPLTGLANRRSVMAWLRRHLAVGNGNVALLCCDLDRFKYVNDGLGHSVGDQLLVEVSRRLAALEPPRSLVGRLGGDEFVVAVAGIDLPGARDLAERILAALRRPLDVAGRRLVVTTSVGVAMSGPDATAETMLRDADAALYRAKDLGRDRAATSDEEARASVMRRLEVEGCLRGAIDTAQLSVAYQPSYELDTGRLAGVEALARWHHPTLGTVAPGEFVPIAEDTGLVVPLGELILDVVTGELGGDAPAGAGIPPTVWVNASGRQLADVTFFDTVERHLEATGGRLGLEVTETVLLEDPSVAERALARLTEAGVLIAIDDFGTGYSSMARLASYPIDLLKIDRSFVAALHAETPSAIVAAIVDLGHALGARVVAEGVETAPQLAALRRLGCDEVCGFYLARPVPVAELTGEIAAGRRRLSV